MEINKKYISAVNTYPGENQPKYIVIHESDNYNTGSGAKRHAEAQFMGHLSNMSAHYYCGSDGIYQAASHEDGTWGVGKDYGGNHSITDASNRNTINIEICVNPDGDYNVARAYAIALVKELIKTTGIPAERVIRHYDAKGKWCPRTMMEAPALWEDFKKQIASEDTKETSFHMNTLKYGSEGYDVTVFEILMKKLGYYTGAIDTTVGEGCLAACNSFQEDHPECGTDGQPDSSWGPMCWAKLFSLNK